LESEESVEIALDTEGERKGADLLVYVRMRFESLPAMMRRSRILELGSRPGVLDLPQPAIAFTVRQKSAVNGDSGLNVSRSNDGRNERGGALAIVEYL
jgi:hypothetical protein